jgi:hypothetical protein
MPELDVVRANEIDTDAAFADVDAINAAIDRLADEDGWASLREAIRESGVPFYPNAAERLLWLAQHGKIELESRGEERDGAYRGYVRRVA